MTPTACFNRIRAFIASDELPAALDLLRKLLANSPLLDEALHQSGRFENIRQQIRLGTVSASDANLTQNQIRAALLDLVREIENLGGFSARDSAGASDGVTQSHPVTRAGTLRDEIERVISIIDSKNVVAGSDISTGGGAVHIGDRNEHTHHHYGGKREVPKHLTAPPFLPELFIGREADIQAIVDRLFSVGGHLLLVNGEGGIGKTSLASRYYHDYCEEYQHVAWVFSEYSIAVAVLALATPLGIQFEESMDTEGRFQVLLTELANLPRPCLLVVDNANRPEDLEEYFPQLERCTNFHILFTTRVNEYASAEFYKINSLPIDKALEAFRAHYKAFETEEKPVFTELYEAVGGNTLVLELFAKNLNHFNTKLKKRYPLADLRLDVENSLLRLTSSEVVSIRYQSKDILRKARAEEIIAAMYDLSELSSEEQALLSVFAVLPAERIAYDLLEGLLTYENKELETIIPIFEAFKGNETLLDIILAQAGLSNQELEAELNRYQNAKRFTDIDKYLLSLAKKGWLDYGHADQSFKVSTVVQEVTKSKNAGRLLDDCRTLIKVLSTGLNNDNRHTNNYQLAAVFARLGAAVVQTLPTDFDVVILCQNIGNYHKDTGNLDGMMQSYRKMLDIQTALFEAEPDDVSYKNGLAISYSKLGDTHRSLGDLKTALTFFEQCNQLEKELHETWPDDVSFKNGLAISYEKLGETYILLGDLEKALTFFYERNRLGKELHETWPNDVSYKNGLAISYEKLGSTQASLGNLEKALIFFEHYNQLEKELHETWPKNVDFKNGLAMSYERLGVTRASLGDLKTALTFFEQCNQLEKELNEAYPQNVEFKNGLAISYEKLGSTQASLGNLEKALTFFEQCNQLEKELHETWPKDVDFKNRLAISYQHLGVTQTSLGNLEKALTFFDQYNQLKKELHELWPHNVNFKEGIGWSNQFLGITHESLGNLENALTHFSEMWRVFRDLHEAWPQNIVFKNGLAISYAKLGVTQASLGNLEKALISFEQCNQLEKELNEAYPQNVEFKNGLAVSYSQLGQFFRDQKEDNNEARNYFEKCKTLWQELVQDFPAYVEFQRNLSWVENALNSLGRS